VPRALFRRIAVLVAAAALIPLAAVPAAQAATACDGSEMIKPFAPFGDLADYMLTPGGDFESGLGGWSGSGASIVADNEPWQVGGAHHVAALRIEEGASVTSPSFCAGPDYRTARLFAKGDDRRSVLRVEMLYTDPSARVESLPLGWIRGSGEWLPSQPILTLSGLRFTGDPFALRFTAMNGAFTVDDVYVDPYSRR